MSIDTKLALYGLLVGAVGLALSFGALTAFFAVLIVQSHS